MLLRVSSRFGSKVRGEVTLVREGLKVFGGLVVDPRMRRDAKRAPSALLFRTLVEPTNMPNGILSTYPVPPNPRPLSPFTHHRIIPLQKTCPSRDLNNRRRRRERRSERGR